VASGECDGASGEAVVASVVMPCLNAEKTLAAQLDALVAQDPGVAWEIIVVDNGSSDASRIIARSYIGRVANLRLIVATERRGAFHAYNAGAVAARGTLVAFCDADDVVAPGWLRALVMVLRTDGVFVGGRMDGLLLNSGWVRASRTVPQSDGLQSGPADFLPCAGSGNLGVRRADFLTVGGFDETIQMLGDTDLCWRMQLAGYELRFAPDAVVHVRLRSTLRSSFRQARDYGWAEQQLVALYPQIAPTGVLWPSIRIALLTWAHPVVDLLRSRDRAGLANVLWQTGWRVGRLQGWFQYRGRHDRAPTRRPLALSAHPDTCVPNEEGA
jgi:GT2 family glycosyltransferase